MAEQIFRNSQTHSNWYKCSSIIHNFSLFQNVLSARFSVVVAQIGGSAPLGSPRTVGRSGQAEALSGVWYLRDQR